MYVCLYKFYYCTYQTVLQLYFQSICASQKTHLLALTSVLIGILRLNINGKYTSKFTINCRLCVS